MSGLGGTVKEQNRAPVRSRSCLEECELVKFLLWCILFVLCWPLALLALVFYPLVWLLLLPFRLVGITVSAVLELVWAVVTLPARVLKRLAS